MGFLAVIGMIFHAVGAFIGFFILGFVMFCTIFVIASIIFLKLVSKKTSPMENAKLNERVLKKTFLSAALGGISLGAVMALLIALLSFPLPYAWFKLLLLILQISAFFLPTFGTLIYFIVSLIKEYQSVKK